MEKGRGRFFENPSSGANPFTRGALVGNPNVGKSVIFGWLKLPFGQKMRPDPLSPLSLSMGRRFENGTLFDSDILEGKTVKEAP